MKTCPKCKITKQITEFNKNVSRNDGLQSTCKGCASVAIAGWQASHKENLKMANARYRLKNSDKRNLKNSEYRSTNKLKVKIYNAKWRAENPEKQKKLTAEWRSANQERVKKSRATYYETNKEKLCADRSAWQLANPEICRINSQNRRARKRSAIGKLSKGLSERLFNMQKGRCPCCNLPLGEDFHLDHIMPLSMGGSNEDSNIQLLRAKCNLQKNASHPVDFMRSRGFLL